MPRTVSAADISLELKAVPVSPSMQLQSSSDSFGEVLRVPADARSYGDLTFSNPHSVNSLQAEVHAENTFSLN